MSPQLLIVAAQVIASAQALLESILKIRERMKQRDEWTDDQEREFQMHIAQRFQMPHWEVPPSLSKEEVPAPPAPPAPPA